MPNDYSYFKDPGVMKGAVHTVPPRNNNHNLKNILNVFFPFAVKHRPTLIAECGSLFENQEEITQ
jgi:hypothetical protein